MLIYAKKDYVKAIEVKMKILAHFVNRSPNLATLLNVLSVKLYGEMLANKLEQSENSIVFYN